MSYYIPSSMCCWRFYFTDMTYCSEYLFLISLLLIGISADEVHFNKSFDLSQFELNLKPQSQCEYILTHHNYISVTVTKSLGECVQLCRTAKICQACAWTENENGLQCYLKMNSEASSAFVESPGVNTYCKQNCRYIYIMALFYFKVTSCILL